MYKAHRLLQSQCTPSIGEGGSRPGHVLHGCFTPHLALALLLADSRWMVNRSLPGRRKQERTSANASGRVDYCRAIAAIGLLRFRNVDRPLVDRHIVIFLQS